MCNGPSFGWFELVGRIQFDMRIIRRTLLYLTRPQLYTLSRTINPQLQTLLFVILDCIILYADC